MSLFADLPEDFLHYVWRSRYYDGSRLRTQAGQPVQVLHPGRWNHDQGPDFWEARLRIGGLAWHGQVELHLHSRDWYRHGHETDPLYNNVVLHVVLESDGRAVQRQDGSCIPEVVLGPHIPPALLDRYQALRLAETQVPCAALLAEVGALPRRMWVERMAIERIEAKAEAMKARLTTRVQDWEQVLWEEIAAMMGGPVNQTEFRRLAQGTPWTMLRRYLHPPEQAEALLWGLAGTLESSTETDSFYQSLRAHWAFIRHKHQLSPLPPLVLRFHRMRPAAFPTIRLSQLAHLLATFPTLIDLLQPEGQAHFLQTKVSAAAYWWSHSRFGDPTAERPKHLGKGQKQVLITNTLIPFGWVYHQAHGFHDANRFIEGPLRALSPENNRHTRAMEAAGFENQDAFHSQGLLQLQKHYCQAYRCLQCGVGHQVLGRQQKKTCAFSEGEQAQEVQASYTLRGSMADWGYSMAICR